MLKKPKQTRWTSFVASPVRGRTSRGLEEESNPKHRVRVEHNKDTILVHLSGEDGKGWTVLAVDRRTRQWCVAQANTQLRAAAQAYEKLYEQAGP
jgi:hypothetical protein